MKNYMKMNRPDIRAARMSVPYDWQRLAFDALVLPLHSLGLTDSQKAGYAACAAKAAPRVTWTPYDLARMEFMREAEALLRICPMANRTANEIRRRMYVCYMENRIRYYRAEEKREHCSLPPVEVREKDFHNTELAAVFAHLPDQPGTAAWLKSLDISWTYDQLHMVTWFSCQLSLGSGKYARSRPNHSAKVTYERLLNPYSLLWIAAALGVERDLVEKTRKEINHYVSWRAKCGVVRRAIPWKRIYELALPLVEKERNLTRAAAG